MQSRLSWFEPHRRERVVIRVGQQSVELGAGRAIKLFQRTRHSPISFHISGFG